ncbi:MAG: DJ-1/PfpI family protein [Tissierellia bacterium]|nr:DJ-1/PfpI family protein [Tissierellia bacterium]
MKKVVLFMENGSEEMEAITQKSILSRAGAEVHIATKDGGCVTTSHGVTIGGDCSYASIRVEDYDAFVLPGGLPGSEYFAKDEMLLGILREAFDKDKIVAAICAAPIALGEAGILKNKKYTCYPGFEKEIQDGEYTAAGTEKDGNLITGKGPFYALHFALVITEALFGLVKMEEVSRGILREV